MLHAVSKMLVENLGTGCAVYPDHMMASDVASMLKLFVCLRPRYDPGVLVSAIGRYFPDLLSSGPDALKLSGPFSKVWTTHVMT